MWVALQKLLTFLQQNINVFENTISTTVYEFVINKLVRLTMLSAIGPWILERTDTLQGYRTVKTDFALLLKTVYT